jgi:hypothetical protein
MRSRTKAVGDEGNPTTVPSELSRVVDADHGRGVGKPKGQSPFYSASAPDNCVDNSQIYLFTPIIISLNSEVSKGQNTSFTRIRASVGRPWVFRSPFLPCERLVVSSAHLEDGTALTDEGLLLGKMAFRSVDVKSAPYAKHTASRTSWLHTRKDFKTCQSIFPEN